MSKEGVMDTNFAEVQTLLKQTTVLFKPKLMMRQVDKVIQNKRGTQTDFLHYLRLQLLKNLFLTVFFYLHKANELSPNADPAEKFGKEITTFVKNATFVGTILEDAHAKMPTGERPHITDTTTFKKRCESFFTSCYDYAHCGKSPTWRYRWSRYSNR